MTRTPVPDFCVYGLVDPRTSTVRYIGKTSHGRFRPENHRQRGASSWKCNAPKRAWVEELEAAGLRYGVVVLTTVTPGDAAALDAEEIRLIAEYRRFVPNLLNASSGGSGANGVKHSAAFRALVSARFKGRRLAPEHAAKIGAANRRRTLSLASRAKISASNRGRVRSAENRAKQSASIKGRKWSDAKRASFVPTDGRPRPVHDQLGNCYPSINAACRALGLAASEVRRTLRGRPAVHGYTFSYVSGAPK